MPLPPRSALAGLTAQRQRGGPDGFLRRAALSAEVCRTWLRPTARRGCCTPWRRAIWRRRAGRLLDGADVPASGPGHHRRRRQVLCTVWLDGGGAPLYAEFTQDSRVVLTARLLSLYFRIKRGYHHGIYTEEDLGGY
ncbi:MAG: hypothetical protein ACLU38_05320 [Dysosmobacter sp.]